MKRLLPLLALVLCLTGCRTATPPLDYRALVCAADRLGVDIGPKDHHALYLEAAQWIGTPYRSGGQSRKCARSIRRSMASTCPAAPPNRWKKASACDAASCAKATWCSSTAANDDVPTT